ncbi:MAG: murein biosynthesis integral membrane protein MurJ [Candidatus Magasanikbacteria bacterium CG11_big_fil_rev_8_21_14_0_20_43_7]|uniref:Probable lipid II flippase MurJ n=1 Tax=Candidatus Magasanikbacteria bacterium CG11_big_fil_rev_8_21_14_0_20_43_7 TaxID=1974654 RepID=A0A2H0N283_9BACT|nr:MAG: murein biosynthesis integral membrane protein MurJ [Candidatus Magasanikbacteria bacterium CG11_big_fil_rev_8_21_14_0_20_43_7]
MIKRLLHNQTSITGAAIILGAASFLSRIIGILRDRIFAHQFGAGSTLDAYYAAFRIPDLVYNLLIVGALSAGFIPVFLELKEKNQTNAWHVTNTVLNMLAIGSLVVCAVLFLFTPFLTHIIVPGFSGEQKDLTIMLARIMFVSPILLGISSLISGVLQSFKAFFIYSLTPIMYNMGIIIGAIFFVPWIGVKGLAYGVILGAVLHLLIQLPMLFKLGFRYRPVLDVRDTSVKRIWKMMIPRTLSLATFQINLLVITMLASTLGNGSITIFNFANNLQYFPVGIIGISFAIAAFPTLSELIAQKKQSLMVDELIRTSRQILFYIIPLSVIFLLLRAQIVRTVFGSGAFDWDATILTADTLALFSLSLFAQALIPLLARGFYALKDTWTPFLIGISGTLVNIMTAIYLKDLYGVRGLALAFSIASVFQLMLLWISLRHKVGPMKEHSFLLFLGKISFSASLMALVVQSLKEPISHIVDMTRLWGIFSQGLIAGLAGIVVYICMSWLFSVEEISLLKQSFTKRWLKLSSVEATVNEPDEV